MFFIFLSHENNKCVSRQNLRNELCFLQDTIADYFLNWDMRKNKLLSLWNDILIEIMTGDKLEYNKNYKYGLYQIQKDFWQSFYEH